MSLQLRNLQHEVPRSEQCEPAGAGGWQCSPGSRRSGRHLAPRKPTHRRTRSAPSSHQPCDRVRHRSGCSHHLARRGGGHLAEVRPEADSAAAASWPRCWHINPQLRSVKGPVQRPRPFAAAITSWPSWPTSQRRVRWPWSIRSKNSADNVNCAVNDVYAYRPLRPEPLEPIRDFTLSSGHPHHTTAPTAPSAPAEGLVPEYLACTEPIEDGPSRASAGQDTVQGSVTKGATASTRTVPHPPPDHVHPDPSAMSPGDGSGGLGSGRIEESDQTDKAQVALGGLAFDRNGRSTCQRAMGDGEDPITAAGHRRGITVGQPEVVPTVGSADRPAACSGPIPYMWIRSPTRRILRLGEPP